jgi:alpha-tubulin suppressor-like RCC1 family protein
MPLNETSSNTTVQYTVTTTNTADGTTLYWKTTGNVSNSDIVGGNTGSIVVTNNRAVFNVTVIADSMTEGNETIGIAIATGSLNGPTVVSTANPITINDTSQDPYYAMYTMGWNGSGPLGLDDRVFRSSPTQVGTDSNWASVSIGGRPGGANSGSGAGIKINGTLWTWGINGSGQLGHSDSISRSSPTQVGTLTNWNLVKISQYNCIAIKNDGTLWTWGSSLSGGVLGHNNNNDYSSPRQVGTDTNWSKIYNSGTIMGAIRTDGTLWLWGYNSYGQLSTGDRSRKSSPTQIGSSTWAELPQNGNGSYNFVAAIRSDGTIWAAGYNADQQLGSGAPRSSSRSSFVQVASGTDWSKLSIGDECGLATKTDGTLWGWGNGTRQQLTSALGSYIVPTKIGTNTNWDKIAMGKYQALATKTDGTLWVWGKNDNGSLGLNGSVDSYIGSPTQVGTKTNWRTVESASSMSILTTNSL